MSRKLATGAALAVAGGVVFAAGNALLAQEVTQSTWSGVYSEAQASRGAASYAKNCAVCHGGQLDGTGEAPSLAGPVFLSNWNGLTVGDLFDRTRTTMPFGRAGSLSRDEYADTLAYMLQANGFPAGQSNLSGRSEMLATIRFEMTKPANVVNSTAQRMSDVQGGQPAMEAATSAQKPSTSGATLGYHSTAPNALPDPYRMITGFFKMPAGRTMGSTSAVGVDSKGHIWIAERCGANSCKDSDLDPIMEFDSQGNFIKAFGGGKLMFPHGFFIDKNDHIWVTDSQFVEGKGNQVWEFDPSGKVLSTLGKAGVAGYGTDVFNEPSAVLVAPNGSIFVSDGHTPLTGNSRVLKFDAQGNFVKQWGGHGSRPGQFDVPHTLAMDSRGRLFLGDRWNNRIQIFDQEGNLLDIWAQFGRPSGMYIDQHDMLYVADSESREPEGYGHNPGWKRGIRIGSVADGKVIAFIPDDQSDPDSIATSGAEGLTVDKDGVIYGAQVKQQRVVKYVKE